eukprot:6190228-Pleurochrysis_carterae.AAC.2
MAVKRSAYLHVQSGNQLCVCRATSGCVSRCRSAVNGLEFVVSFLKEAQILRVACSCVETHGARFCRSLRACAGAPRRQACDPTCSRGLQLTQANRDKTTTKAATTYNVNTGLFGARLVQAFGCRLVIDALSVNLTDVLLRSDPAKTAVSPRRALLWVFARQNWSAPARAPALRC